MTSQKVLEHIFFKVAFFADDVTLTCSFSNMSIEIITSFFNQKLETVNLWLKVNKCNENTYKSYHIVFPNFFKEIVLYVSPSIHDR